MWVVEGLAAMALSLRYTVLVSVWRSIVQEVAEAVASSRGTCCINVVLVVSVAVHRLAEEGAKVKLMVDVSLW